jgi:hypothetical protein
MKGMAMEMDTDPKNSRRHSNIGHLNILDRTRVLENRLVNLMVNSTENLMVNCWVKRTGKDQTNSFRHNSCRHPNKAGHTLQEMRWVMEIRLENRSATVNPKENRWEKVSPKANRSVTETHLVIR